MTGPTPGTAEWLRYMTASKIAAVVGTSPYESRFSLWHRMRGDIPAQPENDQMAVGNILEPALLAWFRQQHPDKEFTTGRWIVHPTVDWAGATPDGFAGPDELVEAKTARDAWEWQAGVPAGYYDQCQWQMWVTNTERTYVVALVAMTLVERVVDRDQDRIDHLVREAVNFMDSLSTGTAPAIDGSTHTYLAVRELHPEIDDDTVTIPHDLAVQWLDAKSEAARWTSAEQQAKTAIADLMGNARRATWNDRTLFTRQARGNGTPYLVAARNLPANGAAA